MRGKAHIKNIAEVALPNSQSEIDRAILSVLTNEWRKTAFIIAKVLHAYEDQGIKITEAQIFERITQLVNSGRVGSQGALKDWRHSEIRIEH